jgi:hypothetical protein
MCAIYLHNKRCWLVGDHLLLLRAFRLYVIIFMNVCAVITIAVVWLSFAVKGFWALWDAVKGGPLCTCTTT